MTWVTSWILNSLAKEIADSVEYVIDSVELWRELEDRYDQTNGAKLYQIQKEINDLSQGVLDITSYYTKMKKLWEELSNLNDKAQCTCVCTCGAKDGTHKAEQDRRLIQFLMGLNEVYTVVRGSILMMNPLPSMAQAFSILVQKEKQREFKPIGQILMESISLNAGNYSTGANPSNSKDFRTNYSTGGNNSMSNTHKACLFFDHCKRSGHTINKCYRLHGYPQDNLNAQNQSHNRNGYNNNNDYKNTQRCNQNNNSRLNKGKRIVANAHGPSTDMISGKDKDTDKENQFMNLTKEQYGHVMNLLQRFQGGEGSGGNSFTSGAVNLKGPFTEEASGNW